MHAHLQKKHQNAHAQDPIHTCSAFRMGLTVSHLEPRMSSITVKPLSLTSSLNNPIQNN